VGVDKAPPAGRPDGGGFSVLIGNELARYWDYFGEEPLELALIVFGLLAGAWWAVRGDRGSRVILVGLLAAFAFFVIAVSTKSKYYMLLTYPFYMLFVGRVIATVSFGWLARARLVAGAADPPRGGEEDRPGFPRHGLVSYCIPPPGNLLYREKPIWRGVWTWARSSVGRATIAAGSIFVLLVGLAAYYPLKAEDRAWENYVRARRYRAGQEYTQLTAQLHQLAGPGARILAPPVYWIGLKEHPYTDIYVFERLNRQMNMTPAQFLDETRPDIVITDAKIATDRRVERLLYNELDTRSTYELIVRHKNYGDVAIYRLRWN
jgi:hypothetical protein